LFYRFGQTPKRKAKDALIALEEVSEKKYLAVVYKEFIDDGFIITAYFTRKIKLEDEEIVWKKKF